MRRVFVPSFPFPWVIGALTALLLPGSAHGEPVFGEVFTYHQPDGVPVRVRVWGDEFYQVVESLDGYTVLRDPDTGFLCYARLADDRTELVSTGVPLGHSSPDGLGLVPHIRVDRDSSKAKARAARVWHAANDSTSLIKGVTYRTTTVGDVSGICLLVDFAEVVGSIAPSEVDAFCNETGYNGFGNNGSVREYFDEVSDGHLTYTNYVTPTYYRAVHSKSYYIDPHVPHGLRARELVLEALNALEDSGFDFSQHDSNDDGFIDATDILTINNPLNWNLATGTCWSADCP